MFEVLEDHLPSAVKMFRRCYDPVSGGYNVPPRHITGAITIWNIFETRRMYPTPLYDSVEAPVADLLFNLCRNTRAMRILETGTSRGFSTCHLAASVADVQDGFVITIDPFPAFEFLWDGSDLSKKITHLKMFIEEAFHQLLIRLGNNMFDFMFFDSLHTYDHLSREIELFEPLLRVGGLIVLHDTMYYDQLGYLAHDLKSCRRFEILNMLSERNHNQQARCPGVTIIRKLAVMKNGERIDFPNRGRFGSQDEEASPNGTGRYSGDTCMVDILGLQ